MQIFHGELIDKTGSRATFKAQWGAILKGVAGFQKKISSVRKNYRFLGPLSRQFQACFGFIFGHF